MKKLGRIWGLKAGEGLVDIEGYGQQGLDGQIRRQDPA